jgi:hypothetical protein
MLNNKLKYVEIRIKFIKKNINQYFYKTRLVKKKMPYCTIYLFFYLIHFIIHFLYE